MPCVVLPKDFYEHSSSRRAISLTYSARESPPSQMEVSDGVDMLRYFHELTQCPLSGKVEQEDNMKATQWNWVIVDICPAVQSNVSTTNLWRCQRCTCNASHTTTISEVDENDLEFSEEAIRFALLFVSIAILHLSAMEVLQDIND